MVFIIGPERIIKNKDKLTAEALEVQALADDVNYRIRDFCYRVHKLTLDSENVIKGICAENGIEGKLNIARDPFSRFSPDFKLRTLRLDLDYEVDTQGIDDVQHAYEEYLLALHSFAGELGSLEEEQSDTYFDMYGYTFVEGIVRQLRVFERKVIYLSVPHEGFLVRYNFFMPSGMSSIPLTTNIRNDPLDTEQLKVVLKNVYRMGRNAYLVSNPCDLVETHILADYVIAGFRAKAMKWDAVHVGPLKQKPNKNYSDGRLEDAAGHHVVPGSLQD